MRLPALTALLPMTAPMWAAAQRCPGGCQQGEDLARAMPAFKANKH